MADHSELIAKLMAAFVTFGCVGFFALVGREPVRPIDLLPAAVPRPSLKPRPAYVDPNEEFLAVPGRWASVDFQNHPYGALKFSDGRKHTLTLKDGERQYDFGDNGRGWFSLYAVYYVDVTGDSIPEAIVDLTHVGCGVSCDGGAHLLFIYSINDEGELKQRFQYETGSYAYGCGLKTLTVEKKNVSLELFGRCPRPGMEAPSGEGKYLNINLTQLTFSLSNGRFVRTKLNYVSAGVIDARDYAEAEVRINHDPS